MRGRRLRFLVKPVLAQGMINETKQIGVEPGVVIGQIKLQFHDGRKTLLKTSKEDIVQRGAPSPGCSGFRSK